MSFSKLCPRRKKKNTLLKDPNFNIPHSHVAPLRSMPFIMTYGIPICGVFQVGAFLSYLLVSIVKETDFINPFNSVGMELITLP